MKRVVRLTIKELAKIPSLRGRGTAKSLPLWDGITAREIFPATNGAAFYELSVEKEATESEIRRVEGQLREALEALARAWRFAGGSLLRTETSTLDTEKLYESNAEQVGEEFLAERGLKRTVKTFPCSVETCAGYSRPPLEDAVGISLEAQANPTLALLLRYHSVVYSGSPKWWVEASKIRDALSHEFGGEKETREALGISRGDWRDFGQILNNDDLRHSPTSGKGRTGAAEKLRRVKRLSREWVERYMQRVGLYDRA
jgi:hypothetical protein